MDIADILTFSALALPSLAFGVHVSRYYSRTRELEDDVVALTATIAEFEQREAKRAIRLDGLVKRIGETANDDEPAMRRLHA